MYEMKCYVLPATNSVHNTAVSANLQGQIKVSTAIDTILLGITYPPSTAGSYIKPIINFLATNGSPL
uniref:Uncharacterized protein n=1 Tax=Manihot esculenta TaxID=3983 RepID=A0A2C9UHM0_MANES